MLRSYLFVIILVFTLFGNFGGSRPAKAAGWVIVSEIQSASVTASANQSFGTREGVRKKVPLTVPALFPEKLETSAEDRFGEDREASGKISLEMNDGWIRVHGKISAKDLKQDDFLAPITTIQGRVKFELKVMHDDVSKRLGGSFRLNGKGAPSLTGEAGKPPPANVVVHVWLNEQTILHPSDFLLGKEAKIPPRLKNGDILTVLFQTDFSLFSRGEAELVSTLTYAFGPSEG